MEFFKRETRIDFMGKRRYAAVLSVVLLMAAVAAIATSYLVSWNRIGGWALMAVGYYSMLAPFMFDYLQQSFAYWNDLVFGVITVGCGAMLAAAGITYGESASGAAGA